MTLEEFFDELVKVNIEHATWVLRGASIRLSKYVGEGKCGDFCPLTAVAFQKTGEYFHPQFFATAAQLLGISRRDANNIATATDNNCWDKELSNIRSNIFKAVFVDG
jgi:hypothetical protein